LNVAQKIRPFPYARDLASGDFNCDGYEDLAIGRLGVAGAGAVAVYFGGDGGLDPNGPAQFFVADDLPGQTSMPGWQFGMGLAAGNFNGDVHPATGRPCIDLAVGHFRGGPEGRTATPPTSRPRWA
jgi:hypothetical protein